MKIRTRLTLIYVFITAIILLIFAISLYYSAKKNREDEFYILLQKEAYSKARIFFNTQIIPSIQQQFYHNNRKFIPEAQVAIYDESFHLVYHDDAKLDILKENPQMLNNFKNYKENHFIQNDMQVIGILYNFRNKSYIITAIAYDKYGFKKLENLRANIIQYLLIAILFIFIVGYYFSNKAFAPIRKIIKKVKDISVTNLNSRLQTKESKDELFELTEAFNNMLDRLESSFTAQKDFVSNISHELRTPLTKLSGELELSIERKKSEKEYKEILQMLFKDTQKLIKLTNNLLDLSKISEDNPEISLEVIRIDEVLLDVQYQVLNQNPNYKIHIDFGKEIENESEISIYGNEDLLQIALFNIIENSCKFSLDQESKVTIFSTHQEVLLHFSDEGIGILEEELEDIFIPFYRGKNRFFTEGSGIGLALTKKIIHLHNGFIDVSSQLEIGTTFTVKLPVAK